MWRRFRPWRSAALASRDAAATGDSMTDLNEQQMRAIELRSEGLRHLTTVALTLAGALATVAGTVFRDVEPAKIWIAAGAFLVCAFAAILAQEMLIARMEGRQARLLWQRLLTGAAHALFGAGWAVLMVQGANLIG